MLEWLHKIFVYSHIISFLIFVLSQLCFMSWSSPPPSVVNWPSVQLCLKVPNYMFVLKWYIIHCLIYFGFIEYLYMHLVWQVFRGNSCITENWVTNSSYARFSFSKEIHALSFVFNFSWEIICFFARSSSFALKFYRNIDKYFPLGKSNPHENSFKQLRYFLTFLLFSLKNNLTRKLRLEKSAIELKLSPHILDPWVSASP